MIGVHLHPLPEMPTRLAAEALLDGIWGCSPRHHHPRRVRDEGVAPCRDGIYSQEGVAGHSLGEVRKKEC